jgi:alcohol dehydrogenase class IV
VSGASTTEDERGEGDDLGPASTPPSSLAGVRLAIQPGSLTYFGAGEISRLPACLEAAGKRRAFVVTDPGVVASGVAGLVAELLDAAGIEFATYDRLRPNPDTSALELGGRALREFGDGAVVGLGGGTALDAAKGFSLAAVNELPPRELDYRRPGMVPGLPLIAVPTTAGTGAETNGFGVFEDQRAGRKFYVGHASLVPRATILDPELTLGVGPAPTAASGMDALTHALESLSSRRANPYAHGLGLEVVRLVSRWLPVAFAEAGDLEARSQMLLAAHLAGLAFSTTGLGLCHAIGHALAARLGAAHGVALSVALPHVLAFNRPAVAAVDAEAAAVMGAASASEGAAALSRALGLPGTLRELGCRPDLLPTLVEDALADEVIMNTPRPPTAGELAVLLEGAT